MAACLPSCDKVLPEYSANQVIASILVIKHLFPFVGKDQGQIK